MAEAEATPARPRLYSYWRSSCSHRVRIALNLKGVEYEYKAVNLLKGEQSDPEFVKLNPMKFVPALVDDDEVIGDSYAIALASIEILAFVVPIWPTT
ncbi:Glutathione S-transferase Z2 [Dichanthelium oligosanthes]|uniref:glutathione transferase n=1 Tax=Dichanthelium oligosanthes TaxID=888268 RepID=A0A1E5VT77_9POAL|nr:Glutathione S-transferase Z2 [Dichanthelium oligosanthes]